jgi:tRNA pseudouridine38-40 synthase
VSGGPVQAGSSIRARMVVAYDGTGFRGLAPNTGVRTVVGELQRVMAPLVGSVPDLVMSGRTDAGVHAWGQVLSADLPAGADLERIQRSVNARLAPEVVLREISQVGAGFSARHSASGRRYRYTIVNRPVPDPFLARWSWWVPQALSVQAMSAAAGALVGEHDFSSFCRRPKVAAGEAQPSLVRRVTGARWVVCEPGDVLRFEIEGSAFCHQMVRSIVGFLVAVGRAKRQVAEMAAVLAARDRSVAEQPAPPHGLVLWAVDYATGAAPATGAPPAEP